MVNDNNDTTGTFGNDKNATTIDDVVANDTNNTIFTTATNTSDDEDDPFFYRVLEPSPTSTAVALLNLSSSEMEFWQSCAASAAVCCDGIMQREKEEEECHATWDGLFCHPHTWSGQRSQVPCPSYLSLVPPQEDFGRDPICIQRACKICDEGGKWNRDENGREVTQPRCGISLDRFKVFTMMGIATYALSSALLFFAVFAYLSLSFKQRKRITIGFRGRDLHVQLCGSLLGTSVSQLLWILFLELPSHKFDSRVMDTNPPWCRLLRTLVVFFRLSNFYWMLAEMWHLYRSVILPFARKWKLVAYWCIGWLPPLLTALIYVIRRLTSSPAPQHRHCWAAWETPFDYITSAPQILILIANAACLTHITCVLLPKLRHSDPSAMTGNSCGADLSNRAQWRNTRKMMVLTPLFGVHLIFLLFTPTTDWGLTDGRVILDIITRLCEGVQGAMVATWFCYSDEDVQKKIASSLPSFLSPNKERRRSSAPVTMVTQVRSYLSRYSDSPKSTPPTRRGKPGTMTSPEVASADFHSASRMRSKKYTYARSNVGSGFNTPAGSGVDTLAGSRVDTPAGSNAGSRFDTPAGSNAGSRVDTPAGSAVNISEGSKYNDPKSSVMINAPIVAQINASIGATIVAPNDSTIDTPTTASKFDIPAAPSTSPSVPTSASESAVTSEDASASLATSAVATSPAAASTAAASAGVSAASVTPLSFDAGAAAPPLRTAWIPKSSCEAASNEEDAANAREDIAGDDDDDDDDDAAASERRAFL